MWKLLNKSFWSGMFWPPIGSGGGAVFPAGMTGLMATEITPELRFATEMGVEVTSVTEVTGEIRSVSEE